MPITWHILYLCIIPNTLLDNVRQSLIITLHKSDSCQPHTTQTLTIAVTVHRAPTHSSHTCTTYLSVNPPWQFRFCHHDNNPKHPEDECVVAEPLSLLKQRPPVAKPVANVPILLLRRPATGTHAALPDQALVGRLAGVFAAVVLGHHHLQARAVQRLQGLRLRVELREIAARRGRQAAN